MAKREIIDEEERQRRRERVELVGTLVWGKHSWQTPLAKALKIPQPRVGQWLLKPSADKEKNVPAKPIPRPVMDALPAIAREAAAKLRRRAAELDFLYPEEGAPPEAQSEPKAGDPAQESGPSASAVEPDFDLDGFMSDVLAAGPSGPIDGDGAMPMPPPLETVRAWSSHIGWYQAPVRR